MESLIPLESEFVFLEHCPYKLIDVWKIYRKIVNTISCDTKLPYTKVTWSPVPSLIMVTNKFNKKKVPFKERKHYNIDKPIKGTSNNSSQDHNPSLSAFVINIWCSTSELQTVLNLRQRTQNQNMFPNFIQQNILADYRNSLFTHFNYKSIYQGR